MAHALLLINEHTSAWVNAEYAPGLRLPKPLLDQLAARFALPEDGPRLAAVWHGDLLVLRADPPLTPRRGPTPYAAPPDLTSEQQRVLAMILEGLTTRQMMRRLGRKRRFVLYRVAEIKRAYGVETRAGLALRIQALKTDLPSGE